MKTEENLDYKSQSFDFIKDSSNKFIIFTLSFFSHSHHHHINLH